MDRVINHKRHRAVLCIAVAAGLPLLAGNAMGDSIWNGSVDANWMTPNNWTAAGVPGGTATVSFTDAGTYNADHSVTYNATAHPYSLSVLNLNVTDGLTLNGSASADYFRFNTGATVNVLNSSPTTYYLPYTSSPTTENFTFNIPTGSTVSVSRPSSAANSTGLYAGLVGPIVVNGGGTLVSQFTSTAPYVPAITLNNASTFEVRTAGGSGDGYYFRQNVSNRPLSGNGTLKVSKGVVAFAQSYVTGFTGTYRIMDRPSASGTTEHQAVKIDLITNTADTLTNIRSEVYGNGVLHLNNATPSGARATLMNANISGNGYVISANNYGWVGLKPAENNTMYNEWSINGNGTPEALVIKGGRLSPAFALNNDSSTTGALRVEASTLTFQKDDSNSNAELGIVIQRIDGVVRSSLLDLGTYRLNWSGVAGTVAGLSNCNLAVDIGTLTPADLSGKQFTILTAQGDLTDMFANVTGGVLHSGNLTANVTTTLTDNPFGTGGHITSVILSDVSVPEPATVGLLMITALPLLGRRQRKA